MNKPRFFIGTEYEGKYSGLKTLFVVGDQSYDSIIQTILNSKDDTEQIYFGAYHQSKIRNWKTVLDIANTFSKTKMVITVEVLLKKFNRVPLSIIENEKIHKIFSTNLKKKEFENITLKLENKKGVYCYCDPFFNDYSEYKNDIVIS